ncbi:hypothetical protein [Streptomyces sp. WMMC940]|uniref:hypothetical protein n=1 Tax=Streptomyces sp. WMMC940 TaxID=3015153 RepID=UPI0022B6410C|nr:hypothetical protein [Streptomyces sp. WMMC940]MCZ7461617.1 hypothetical protein [Streptomyces sp. WMMC940]
MHPSDTSTTPGPGPTAPLADAVPGRRGDVPADRSLYADTTPAVDGSAPAVDGTAVSGRHHGADLLGTPTESVGVGQS